MSLALGGSAAMVYLSEEGVLKAGGAMYIVYTFTIHEEALPYIAKVLKI